MLFLTDTWAETKSVNHSHNKRKSNGGVRQGVVFVSTAFVLFKCLPQMEKDVFIALLNLECVTETHVSYGEYDLVARIEFDNEKEMAKTLIGNMRALPGVLKTETLIAVEA